MKCLNDDCGGCARVAHWAILDGETILTERTPGETYTLRIEPFDDHPELEGERLMMETEDLTSPMFFGVTL